MFAVNNIVARINSNPLRLSQVVGPVFTPIIASTPPVFKQQQPQTVFTLGPPKRKLVVGDAVRWSVAPSTKFKITAITDFGREIWVQAEGEKAIWPAKSYQLSLWKDEVTLPVFCLHVEGSTPIALSEKNLESWYVCKLCGEALRPFSQNKEMKKSLDMDKWLP